MKWKASLQVSIGLMVMAMTVMPAEARRAIFSTSGKTVPRACTLTEEGFSGQVKVQACPDTEECPTFMPCSTGSGTCALWTYQFNWQDIEPEFAGLSVSSDIPIASTTDTVATKPGRREKKFGTGKEEFGQRWLRFDANARTHQVIIETPAEIGAGVAGTAAARSNRFSGFCLILTPGARVADASQAQTTRKVDELECGTVTRLVDLQGRTISAEPSEGCTVSTTTLTNDEGQPVMFVNPDAQITFDGSTRYCWVSVRRRLICVQ